MLFGKEKGHKNTKESAYIILCSQVPKCDYNRGTI